MALYEIVVKIVREHESIMFVEAEDLDSAMKYCKSNSEWHTDENLFVIKDNERIHKKPLYGRRIKNKLDMRMNIEERHPVWPASMAINVGEVLERGE